MSRKLINDRDLRYRVEKQNEYDKIQEILAEEAKESEIVENAWLESLDVINEEVEMNYQDVHKEEKRKNELLSEESVFKLQDTARKLFSEIVLEAIPLTNYIKNTKKDEILLKACDVYDELSEAGVINTSNNTAWGVLVNRLENICSDSNKTIYECYVDVVNDEKDLLIAITESVSKKIENAIKLEQTFTTLKEQHSYISEKPSMLRCLVESEYKKLNENVKDPANVALVEGAISYAIIETINTSRMLNIDYDFVVENYRFLGR